MSSNTQATRIPQIEIDVVEPGRHVRKGRTAFELGRDVDFSTTALESYAFARWEPLIYDAMVLAAAIEYGDKILKRPPHGWTRRFSLRIPVHDPDRWNAPLVAAALRDAIEFLTGDYWALEFVTRSSVASSPPQNYLSLPVQTKAVLPYSDGMDSRAVAGILAKSLGNTLVRVRVGSKSWDRLHKKGTREPFTTVPYTVCCTQRNRESSSRSRGFKFTLISAIAAYLANAEEIIIPESGQGCIGPALINVGHGHPDFRNHPLFTVRMARFINELLGTQIRFVFPRIWSTKGETLREFVSLSEGSDWKTTRSCWQSNNWCSVNGKLRQCGVCAACMLRRVSVHAAGLTERADVYVAIDMDAETLDDAIDKDFTKLTQAFREYAVGGILHMDHLAEMAGVDAIQIVKRHAILIAPALNLSCESADKQLNSLLRKHAEQWKNYLDSLRAHSFVRQLIRTN
jgi:7-cyano-7-deazaguanine synthase in queuosine biosynthesis